MFFIAQGLIETYTHEAVGFFSERKEILLQGYQIFCRHRNLKTHQSLSFTVEAQNRQNAPMKFKQFKEKKGKRFCELNRQYMKEREIKSGKTFASKRYFPQLRTLKDDIWKLYRYCNLKSISVKKFENALALRGFNIARCCPTIISSTLMFL